MPTGAPGTDPAVVALAATPTDAAVSTLISAPTTGRVLAIAAVRREVIGVDPGLNDAAVRPAERLAEPVAAVVDEVLKGRRQPGVRLLVPARAEVAVDPWRRRRRGRPPGRRRHRVVLDGGVVQLEVAEGRAQERVDL